MGRHSKNGHSRDNGAALATSEGATDVAALPEDELTASQANAANEDEPEIGSPELASPDGAMTVKVARLEVPACAEPLSGYRPERVEMRLTGAQAETLRRITEALHAGGAKLAGGRKVQTGAHALAWVLEEAGRTLGVL